MPFEGGFGSSVRKFIWGTLRELVAILFQPLCPGCGKSTASPLCEGCRAFVKIRSPLCRRCGGPTSTPVEVCGREHLKDLIQMRSMWWLTQEALALMHKIKYERRFEFLNFITDEIDLVSFFPSHTIFVPVPIVVSKWVDRGFNQSSLLARALSRRLGNGVDEVSLRKVKPTIPQAGLSKVQRMRNVRRSFKWVSSEKPKSVCLVDDIFTTGSTLAACAKVLRKSGIEEIYAWTAFRTPEFRIFSPK
jgi:ComF family protein